VLHNLITNAEQAIPRERKNGLIRVTLAPRREGGVLITVADNGTGVPAGSRHRIFDPFFTTKRPGEGTGLGLSICHTIMAAHGGTITLAESSPTGTTFALELPRPEPALLFRPPSAPPFHGLGDASRPVRGRLLVVDDETHIAEAVTAYLAQQNFDVTSANGAEAALALLGEAAFDIVISDMRMPGMDGVKFHETTCRRHPRYKQRFIFMSGYLMHPRVRAFLTSTRLPCLEKPFSFDELERTILRHLESLGDLARAS
jgi:CheY-like chemotaxis protein